MKKGLSKKFLVQIKKQENSLLCEFSCFFYQNNLESSSKVCILLKI